ncbi:MAG: EamA family transporter [Chloroflexi bacterium]|nr:EamA family transporter [Chloroflexota bacterium]
MTGIELTAVFYGLAAAANWGAGDFSGGVATKRSHVYLVVLLSHIVGIAGLFALILLFGEPFPTWRDLWVGALGGISGAIGVLALYTGLAQGRMGVVAPLTAIVTGIVPVLFGFFIEGLPQLHQSLGFGVALLAVWLISGDGDTARLHWEDLRLPSVAGLGFGFFFIFIDQVSDNAILWPLVGSRAASILMMFVLVLLMRRWEQLALNLPKWPSPPQLGWIALAGLFDAGGNAFFALATSLGRLDIAAILSSLYPATTILLARFILDERISRRQWVGIVAALTAVILIAV